MPLQINKYLVELLPVESGILVQPFRAATGREVVQARIPGRYYAIGLRPWMPNEKGCTHVITPLTLKPS